MWGGWGGRRGWASPTSLFTCVEKRNVALNCFAERIRSCDRRKSWSWSRYCFHHHHRRRHGHYSLSCCSSSVIIVSMDGMIERRGGSLGTRNEKQIHTHVDQRSSPISRSAQTERQITCGSWIGADQWNNDRSRPR